MNRALLAGILTVSQVPMAAETQEKERGNAEDRDVTGQNAWERLVGPVDKVMLSGRF